MSICRISTGDLSDFNRAEGAVWTEHLIYIPCKQHQYLSATFTLPRKESTQPVPAVLLCHGFTGNRIETRRLFVLFSRQLAARGIASIRFDYRGSGESSGDFSEYCFTDYVVDAEHALVFLKTLACVDSKKIGVLGYSLGGCVASYLVGGHATEFAAICLWAPVADTRSIMESLYGEQMDIEKIVIDSPEEFIYDFNGVPVSRRFIKELWNANPLEQILAALCPVFICHGTDDETVPPHHTEKYNKVLISQKKSVEIYWQNKANHSFASIEQANAILSKSTRWLGETLGT